MYMVTLVQQAWVPACESPWSTEMCWDWLRSGAATSSFCPSGSEEVGHQGLCLLDSLLLCALPLPCCLGVGDFFWAGLNAFSVLFSSALVPHPNKHPSSVQWGKAGLWGGQSGILPASAVFEYLSEWTQDKHSIMSWNPLSNSSTHVFWKNKTTLVKMCSVKPQTLTACCLSSKLFGACNICWYKLKAVNGTEMSFGWLAVSVPHCEVYYLECCHSSSSFSCLQQFIHKSDIKLLVLRTCLSSFIYNKSSDT